MVKKDEETEGPEEKKEPLALLSFLSSDGTCTVSQLSLHPIAPPLSGCL